MTAHILYLTLTCRYLMQTFKYNALHGHAVEAHDSRDRSVVALISYPSLIPAMGKFTRAKILPNASTIGIQRILGGRVVHSVAFLEGQRHPQSFGQREAPDRQRREAPLERLDCQDLRTASNWANFLDFEMRNCLLASLVPSPYQKGRITLKGPDALLIVTDIAIVAAPSSSSP